MFGGPNLCVTRLYRSSQAFLPNIRRRRHHHKPGVEELRLLRQLSVVSERGCRATTCPPSE